jgi:hypothetical protein
MPLSTIFQLYCGGQFIGGGNQSTRRKPPTCRKSLTNFITDICLNIVHNSLGNVSSSVTTSSMDPAMLLDYMESVM